MEAVSVPMFVTGIYCKAVINSLLMLGGSKCDLLSQRTLGVRHGNILLVHREFADEYMSTHT